MSINKIDIITIDGPAASGKGTIAKLVAKKLNFNYLDSGSIYRALALQVMNTETNKGDVLAMLKLIQHQLQIKFTESKIILNGKDVTKLIRTEKVGKLASDISKYKEIREALLSYQRSFAVSPGLVTDGRDMGSVVFRGALLKVFLTASDSERAKRRVDQLQGANKFVIISSVLQEIVARDQQDSSRESSPLTYDASYKFLDNTTLTIEETVMKIIQWYKEIKLKG